MDRTAEAVDSNEVKSTSTSDSSTAAMDSNEVKSTSTTDSSTANMDSNEVKSTSTTDSSTANMDSNEVKSTSTTDSSTASADSNMATSTRTMDSAVASSTSTSGTNTVVDRLTHNVADSSLTDTTDSKTTSTASPPPGLDIQATNPASSEASGATTTTVDNPTSNTVSNTVYPASIIASQPRNLNSSSHIPPTFQPDACAMVMASPAQDPAWTGIATLDSQGSEKCEKAILASSAPCPTDTASVWTTTKECGVCLEPFDGAARKPETLLCGHTFCHHCVVQLAWQVPPGCGFPCPVCRTETRRVPPVPEVAAPRSAKPAPAAQGVTSDDCCHACGAFCLALCLEVSLRLSCQVAIEACCTGLCAVCQCIAS